MCQLGLNHQMNKTQSLSPTSPTAGAQELHVANSCHGGHRPLPLPQNVLLHSRGPPPEPRIPGLVLSSSRLRPQAPGESPTRHRTRSRPSLTWGCPPYSPEQPVSALSLITIHHQTLLTEGHGGPGALSEAGDKVETKSLSFPSSLSTGRPRACRRTE